MLLLPNAVLQVPALGPRPSILPEHRLRALEFSHFLSQRALRVHNKDKDRRTWMLTFRLHRTKLIEEVEFAKEKSKSSKDQLSCLLYSTIYGENYLDVRNGIYLDMMLSFRETNQGKRIYDLGLTRLFKSAEEPSEPAPIANPIVGSTDSKVNQGLVPVPALPTARNLRYNRAWYQQMSIPAVLLHKLSDKDALVAILKN